MLLKNWASFQIRSKKLLNTEHVEDILLQDIIKELNKRDIACSEIKLGHFCSYTICKVRDCEISVVVFSVTREHDSSMRSSISCRNYFRIPWWKRMLIRVPQQAYDSGKSVKIICEHINEILSLDQRINQIKWLTREEYFDTTRPSSLDIEPYITKHGE